MQSKKAHPSERRGCVRLAARAALDLAVVDRFDQPVVLLREVALRNVSGGGLAFDVSEPVEVGAELAATVPAEGDQEPLRFGVTVLACEQRASGRYGCRCRLSRGTIPARLAYGL